jgi:flagellar hook assembly protein FlgD
VLGQLVRTLLDEEKQPGNYQIIWDGKDQKGNEVSSGIYFYQLKSGDYKETRKMTLLR